MVDDPRIVVVTGANSGIGFAACRQLAERGVTVVMGCRSVERGEAARDSIVRTTHNPRVHLIPIDTASIRSVEDAARGVRARWPAIHALINNAGNFDLSQREPAYTDEGTEVIWATNYLGPYWLTAQLRDALEAAGPGRVIDVSSKGLLAHPFLKVAPERANRLDRYSPERAYYHSKLALLTHTLALAQRADRARLVAHAVWVPAVQISLDRLPPMPAWQRSLYLIKRRLSITPDEMARTYVALALDEEWGASTGALVDHRLRRVQPPRATLDGTAADQLDAATRAQIGVVLERRSTAAH